MPKRKQAQQPGSSSDDDGEQPGPSNRQQDGAAGSPDTSIVYIG